MWISREFGQRRAIFPIFIRANAIRHRQNREQLIHGTLCCGESARTAAT